MLSHTFWSIEYTSITFMKVRTELLHPFIGIFLVAYFDDILIYSGSLEDHLVHVREVFVTCRLAK